MHQYMFQNNYHFKKKSSFHLSSPEVTSLNSYKSTHVITFMASITQFTQKQAAPRHQSGSVSEIF